MRLLGITSLLLAFVICLVTPAQASDWLSWWKTDAQRAEEAYRQGNANFLIENGPDEHWQGLGHHQLGNYIDAANAFAAKAEKSRESGNVESQLTSLYNYGTSQVQAGSYQAAIDSFNELLDLSPEHSDALHNKAIAEKLLALEQAQSDSDSGSSQDQQQNDSSDRSDGNQSQGSSENSEDSREPQQGQQEMNEDASSNESQSRDDQSENASSGSNRDQSLNNEAGSEEQQNQDAAAAEQALAAEAEAASQEEMQSGDADTLELSQEPMTESQQASEQLLRQIPDDPVGLLRNKLQQSHRLNYPEVNTSNAPW